MIGRSTGMREQLRAARAKRRRSLLLFAGAAVAVAAIVAIYLSVARSGEPIYSPAATKRCLEQRGHSVRLTVPGDVPDRLQLAVDEKSRPDNFSSLSFFFTAKEARLYSQQDSATLPRRGNVVFAGLTTAGVAGCLRGA